MIKNKICSKCKKQKTLTNFYKYSKSKDGLSIYCKLCNNIWTNKWRENNKTKESLSNKLRRQKNLIEYNKTAKIYREKNKNKIYKKTKEWKKNNKLKIVNYNNQYYFLNKQKIIAKAVSRIRNKRKNNKNFKIMDNMRSRISSALSYHKISKTKRTIKLLGCSYKEFWIHLEKQFTKGMTRENYGKHGWHIDHIIPLSSAKNIKELEKLFHYTNTQPLWAKDNLSKGDKIL
jgi:hypothetical protein